MTETKKLYHSISEVSQRLGVKPHVLRYWESQFRWLRPKKNRAGNRSYQEKDLALLEQIRELLYDRRFTIEGARQELDRRRQAPGPGGETGPEVSPGAAAVPVSRAGESPSPPRSAASLASASPGPGSAAETQARRLRDVRTELRGLKEWLESRP